MMGRFCQFYFQTCFAQDLISVDFLLLLLGFAFFLASLSFQEVFSSKIAAEKLFKQACLPLNLGFVRVRYSLSPGYYCVHKGVVLPSGGNGDVRKS